MSLPTFPTHLDGNSLPPAHHSIHGQAWSFLLLLSNYLSAPGIQLQPKSLPFLDWGALESTLALNPVQKPALHLMTAVSVVEEGITKLFPTTQKRKGLKMLQTQTPHRELITPSPAIHVNRGKGKTSYSSLCFSISSLCHCIKHS